MKTVKPFILAALGLSSLAWAQTPRSGPAPDSLVSPEVHPDHSVTFRIRAPKASEVTISGDFMQTGTSMKLEKGSDGVWSITTAPLDPTVHLYFFNVDGVTMADPVNPSIKLRQRTSASLVEVPADSPAPWSMRDVPHGSVDVNWKPSKIITYTVPQIWVYLPPGYEKGNTHYPVLYLLHGSGDVPNSWTIAGNANLILDNLIADKKAKPMIVVMPLGHSVAPSAASANGPEMRAAMAGGAAPPAAVPLASATAGANNTQVFETYFLNELMPFVEAKYRVAPGRQNRAMAGLSMGGGETSYVGFGHLDLFSALGIFSASGGAQFATKNAAVLADAKGTNSKLNVLWVGMGDHDPGYNNAKKFVETLNENHIHNTFRVIEGGQHTWPVWRVCLSEFAPLLFQSHVAPSGKTE